MRPPVAVNDQAVGEEDGGPITGNVLGNDSDPDQDPLTVTSFSVNGKNAAAGDTITIDNVGTITIKPNGDYVFTPVPNYNGTVPPIHYTITDGSKQDDATLTIIVTPIVDLVAEDDSNETDEDTPIDGTVADNDSTTSGGTLTFEKATDPANGSVVMRPDGSYTYTPNPNFNGTDSFTYTVTDPASGETLTKTVTIIVNPVDDLEAEDDSNVTDEDTPVDGTVADNDSTTSGGTLIFEKTTDPANGSVEMQPDGSYTYTPNPDFNGTDSFTYTVTDPDSGEEATKTVTIIVNPINDAPVIAEDDAAADVVEASLQSDRSIDPGTPTVSGSFSATDVDGDDLTWSVVTPDTTYGTFTIDPETGAWDYELNNDLPAVQELNAGDTVELTFTVQVSDGQGGTDSRTVTITITGANDAPVAVADTNTVTESGVAGQDGVPDSGNTPAAGNPVATGNVLTNDSDIDDGETDTLTAVPQTVDGIYGTLVLNADGSYTYTLDNSRPATQALPKGAEVNDVFNYTVVDVHGATHGSTLTITVTGANDRPVIDGATSVVTGEVTEQGADNPTQSETATGQLFATDVDDDAEQTWSIGTPQGTYGSIEIDADGVWVYTIDNDSTATQALAKGETRTETFIARVTDEHGAYSEKTITITITGSNDAPVAVADVNTVIESGVAAQDGVPNSGNTPVAGKNTATGNVLTNDTDIDAGETDTMTAVPKTFAGTYGDFVLNADGSYTYTLDNSRPATQALAKGAVVTDVLPYEVQDVHGAKGNGTLTITVTGTNDRPEIDAAASDLTGAVTEQGADNPTQSETATGQLFATDVDAGATQTWSIDTTEGTYGSITLNADGEWTYTLDNSLPATQALAKGETRTETFIARVTDEHGAYSEKTITITITGSNDAPVAVADVNTVIESGVAAQDGVPNSGNTPVAGKNTATGNVLANDTDIDADETATLTAVPKTFAGTYGDFVLNADGSYTYTLDNNRPATQALAKGAVVTDVLPYEVQDVHGAKGNGTLTITVTGTNDRPEIDAAASDLTGAVTERGVDNPSETQTATGQLFAADVDTGAEQTWSIDTTEGTYGSITLNADGEWTYTLDNSLPETQALAKGETRTETFIARVTDEHGAYSEKTITITITGSNDAPVAMTDVNTVIESGVAEQDGVPDSGNTPVAGKNTATGNVLTNDTDIDAGETATLTAVPKTFAGTYGDFVLNADGSYTYTLDNNRPATQALAKGAVVTDVLPYEVQDVHGAKGNGTLTITVTGTNDRPEIDATQSGLSGSITEQGTANPDELDTVSGTVVATDVDAGAEQEWTIDDTQGTYGSIEIDPDTGKWVYTLDNGLDATQALNTGESRTERFTVRVTDEHGAYSEQVIVITVNGSNDLATGLGDQNIPLDEDNVASGSIQDFIEDVDDTVNVIGFSIDADGDGVDEDYLPGESVTLFAGGKELGTVTIAVNGDYSFTPAPNYSGPVPPLSYTVQEGNGTQEITQKLTFVIAPVSDAPTLPDPSTVDTLEDNSVTLGLVTPVITDTGTGNGDVTERLGEITLTVGGAGATGVTFDMGGVILTPVDGKLTIILTDVPHVEGLPTADPDTGVYYMTPAQYEALKAVPAPESGKNFTVTADVTSYEVDADGNILDDVPGALSSQTITVDVQAVTDGVTLSKVVGTPANPAIDEDGTYNLTDKLTVALGDSDGNAGTDDDGSETYWFEISDLPVGSTINIDGVITTITSVGQVVTSEVSNSPTVPSIIFGPPPHFSGELPPFTVTIKTQDTDTDSPDHTPDILSSSVTFELDVRPIANDVDVGTITTPEDTAVNFLENVRITDTNGDGQEVINAISFTIPVGWVVEAPPASAGWTYVVTGDQATITFSDDASAMIQTDREAILDGFTIQPPAHSSEDVTIALSITTTDKATINGVEVVDSKTEDHDLDILVTPVAERTDTDSDEDMNVDVTMSGSHEYDVTGEEDAWFALGTTYTGAANSNGGFAGLGGANVWTNSDSDEYSYAVLTPTLDSDNADDSVIGTTFRFSTDGGTTWETRVYDGNPVWIPAEFLNTLQVKLPADVAGTLTIGVQAGTVDIDDDLEKNLTVEQRLDQYLNPPIQYGEPAAGQTVGALSSSNPNASVDVSGSSELTMIEFKPVADDVTMALNGRASGLEDTDIPLSIRTTTSDPSETINVTISDIPVGATITYTVKGPDGTPVVTTFTATDGNQSMTIIGFDNDAKVTITPPLHSNADFTLNVSAVSVDGSSVLADPVTRPIYVQVQGVADVTTVVLSNSGSVTEAALDTSGNKIALSQFVTTVTSPDTDGSETLTLRITGLDANFTLVGATLVTAGTGTERVWSIPVDPNYDPSNPDHVNPFDNIFVVLPPNFSGKVSMEVTGVSTENDGDSLTGARLPDDEPLIVTKDVIPSIDSIITTEFVLTEDQISPVNLQIVHQNGDTDEMLTEVYIPVNYDATQYEIYLGTATLADSELTIVQIDGVDYYVIPSAQLPNLGVKASENLDGDVRDLPIKYQITDPATLGPLDPGTEIKDATLEFTVNPVTDPVELDIADIDMDPAKGTITLPVVGEPDSRFTVNVIQSGTVTVQINATSNDDDGSEQVTRVLIQNVPEGVTINGASMIGNGEWLLVLPAQDPANPNSNMVIDGNGQSIDLEFVVGIGTSDGLSNIKITVQTQDRGTADPVQEDEIDFNLDVKLGDGGTFQLPTIDEWSFTPVADDEDTRFALDQVIDGKVTLNETGAKHLLAITLTDLPDGTKVEYGPDGQLVEVQRTWVADNSPEGGKFVWTIAVEVPVGGNGQSVLDQMLQDIRITPPANSNDNNADFTLDAQLKVVVVGGPSVSDKVVGDVPITPVTDQPSLSITTSNVDEGSSSITAVIAGGPSANDNGNAVIVDGKVYVSVTATGNPDGVLSRVEMVDDGEGGLVAMKVPLVLESVTGVDGVPDGDYYVIDTNNTALPVTLDFSAPDGSGLILGDVVFDAILQSKETGAANTETANASGTSEVKLANNGAEITVAPATGDEAVLADKANAIRLEGLSVTLNDSSELIKAIMLTGLPNGFLLYIGEDAGSATLANQASNAGGDGSTNTWILAEGNKNLPPFIAILPPAHWSGTIEDLMIIVASGESQLNDTAYDSSDPFTLTIASRPNGITIDPTNSFGVEGRPILLNLNAAMVDNAAALSPVQDSSTETTTLEIKGLGEHAAFDVDGVLYNNVTYNAVTDVYTITGLTQAQLDKLAVVQAANAITDQDSAKAGVQIDVTAWTVEGDTGAESDKVNAKLNLAVTPVLGTTGADHFIWGDHKIDGKAGIDTVSLRVGEDVSRADLVAKLKNIEEIDLSVKGANGISGGLTLADVVSITGKSTGTLTITGDADDFITLSTGSGWTTTGVAQDGYVAYTSGNATLLIDEDILATNITFV